ncbi:MAG: hypothetical protein H6721_31995 [Sandaracinus sp.]|nr:hypothetical protein [Sandaracinus sp.]
MAWRLATVLVLLGAVSAAAVDVPMRSIAWVAAGVRLRVPTWEARDFRDYGLPRAPEYGSDAQTIFSDPGRDFFALAQTFDGGVASGPRMQLAVVPDLGRPAPAVERLAGVTQANARARVTSPPRTLSVPGVADAAVVTYTSTPPGEEPWSYRLVGLVHRGRWVTLVLSAPESDPHTELFDAVVESLRGLP